MKRFFSTPRHNSHLKASQRGEVVTMLTVLAVVIVSAGLAFGIRLGLQADPQTTRTSAQGSCSYKTFIHVYREDGESFFGAGEIGTLTAKNDRQQVITLNQRGRTEYEYAVSNLKFDPRRITNYAENDPAYVELLGYDKTRWKVKRVFCNNHNQGVRGCPENFTIAQTNAAIESGLSQGIKIDGFRVNCGVNLTYGWVMEEIDGDGGGGGGDDPDPTAGPPAPTGAPQACFYRTSVKVVKLQPTLDNIPLQLSELGGKLLTAQGSSGPPLPLNEGGRAQSDFRTEYFPISAIQNRTEGDPATVTLGGLDPARWKVDNVYCLQKPGSIRGCPTASDQLRMNQAIRAGASGLTIDGFRVNCGVDIEYGWTVTDLTEIQPTEGPLTGVPPTGVPPTGVPPTTVPPVPTGAPQPTSNPPAPTGAPQPTKLPAPTAGPTDIPDNRPFVDIIVENFHPGLQSVILKMNLEEGCLRPCSHRPIFDGRINESQTFRLRYPLSPSRDLLLESFNMMNGGPFTGRVVVEVCSGGHKVPYGQPISEGGPLQFQKCFKKSDGTAHFTIHPPGSNLTFPALDLLEHQMAINSAPLKNVLLGNEANIDEDGGLEFFNNSLLSFTFYGDDQRFFIDLFGSDDPVVRKASEVRLLDELEVSRNEACALDVRFVNGGGLSYCGSPQQEDINADSVVNGVDYAQCLLDLESTPTVSSRVPTHVDLLCDFNIDRRIDSLDLSRVLTAIEMEGL